MAIEFEHTIWLLLTPTLLSVYLLLRNKLQSFQNTHTDRVSIYIPYDLHQANVSSSTQQKGLLNWFIIFLLSLALAQPVIKTKRPPIPEHTKDIFFIIDTSVGMSIKDYLINDQGLDRLNLVKVLLVRFINQLDNNRTGTIVYADESYVLTPLTSDKALAISNIKRIRTAVAGRRNNLGNALNTFLQYSKSLNSKPTVVVFSQGANIERTDNIAAIIDKYRTKDIKLHFVGVGSEIEKQSNTNKLIYDPINKELLAKLAKQTGGDFFWAGSEQRLETTLQKIKSNETLYTDREGITFKQQYYLWPLYSVLILLFLRYASFTILRFK